ncbi:MAG: ATP-dependent DNA helicase RecG [Oscillospiraceae bacterium]|nr:ATP-dependent DNA helicase RecG [Oscillospiraceae bacterium]
MPAASEKTEFLDRSVSSLRGVGARRSLLYSRIGIRTVGDLLRHYPRNYANYVVCEDLSSAEDGAAVSVKARVDRKTQPVRIKGGRTMQRVYAVAPDGSSVELTYFNNPYATAKLETGSDYVFHGRIQKDLFGIRMINPVIVQENEMGMLIPQYSLTEGLSSRMIASNVRQVLHDPDFSVGEVLPDEVLKRYGLIGAEEALRKVHFPKNDTEAAEAKKRLVFEELLILSLGIKLRRKTISGSKPGYTDLSAEEFCSSLPFELTGAQKKCIREISEDLAGCRAMNRLLQGDVGSGKTAVAAAAVYLAWKNGHQSAVMAPTEVLAEQHAETFRRYLEPFGITVGLLTGSVKGTARKTLLKQIASGGADVIVGTHAVISEGVEFRDLDLVITDEQHRFGVSQRAMLSGKGTAPHTLVMSATPIPRTLSLIVYGDLDISVLDELPKGRKRIRTVLVDESYRDRYLGFVRKTVEDGHQAYIVCPLIDESDALPDTVSATEYFEQLKEKWLDGIMIGLLHGKMSSQEKSDLMDRFRTGEVKVLVSTTVIEVGVDCPNATLMIIENAERFGLSTLHQLRGRIGRGQEQSWCVLVSSSDSGTAKQRLNLLVETDDGFRIATEDLRMRGPGDFLGSRQHGLPSLDVADIADDEKTLYTANDAAGEILAKDPGLENNPVLMSAVRRLFTESGQVFN